MAVKLVSAAQNPEYDGTTRQVDSAGSRTLESPVLEAISIGSRTVDPTPEGRRTTLPAGIPLPALGADTSTRTSTPSPSTVGGPTANAIAQAPANGTTRSPSGQL